MRCHRAVPVLALILGSTISPSSAQVVREVYRPGPNAGCWVHVFADENFRGTHDVILGPGRFPTMRRLPGAVRTDWGGDIDSLVVGPGAVVRVFEDEGFRGNPVVFGPGQAVGNLDRASEMGDAIESMDIRCR